MTIGKTNKSANSLAPAPFVAFVAAATAAAYVAAFAVAAFVAAAFVAAAFVAAAFAVAASVAAFAAAVCEDETAAVAAVASEGAFAVAVAASALVGMGFHAYPPAPGTSKATLRNRTIKTNSQVVLGGSWAPKSISLFHEFHFNWASDTSKVSQMAWPAYPADPSASDLGDVHIKLCWFKRSGDVWSVKTFQSSQNNAAYCVLLLAAEHLMG